MKENGKRVWEMVKVNILGLMAVTMMESGFKTKHMAKVNLYMSMEMSMKENGWTIWQMEKVFICIVEEQSMRENGKMIYKTDKGLKLGLIMLAMKEAISTARKMDTELFCSQIKVDTPESF
jgi:hypothetical protein